VGPLHRSLPLPRETASLLEKGVGERVANGNAFLSVHNRGAAPERDGAEAALHRVPYGGTGKAAKPTPFFDSPEARHALLPPAMIDATAASVSVTADKSGSSAGRKDASSPGRLPLGRVMAPTPTAFGPASSPVLLMTGATADSGPGDFGGAGAAGVSFATSSVPPLAAGSMLLIDEHSSERAATAACDSETNNRTEAVPVSSAGGHPPAGSVASSSPASPWFSVNTPPRQRPASSAAGLYPLAGGGGAGEATRNAGALLATPAFSVGAPEGPVRTAPPRPDPSTGAAAAAVLATTFSASPASALSGTRERPLESPQPYIIGPAGSAAMPADASALLAAAAALPPLPRPRGLPPFDSAAVRPPSRLLSQSQGGTPVPDAAGRRAAAEAAAAAAGVHLSMLSGYTSVAETDATHSYSSYSIATSSPLRLTPGATASADTATKATTVAAGPASTAAHSSYTLMPPPLNRPPSALSPTRRTITAVSTPVGTGGTLQPPTPSPQQQPDMAGPSSPGGPAPPTPLPPPWPLLMAPNGAGAAPSPDVAATPTGGGEQVAGGTPGTPEELEVLFADAPAQWTPLLS